MARVAQIILDYSANTFKNDKKLIKRGIDEIKKIDSGKHEIVFKTQLFIKAGDNIPCTHESFEYLYEYGNSQGYKVTASVFDKESLDYLLMFDVPFIKLSNDSKLLYDGVFMDALRTSPKYNLYASVSKPALDYRISEQLICISEYPASKEAYRNALEFCKKNPNISDHTEDWDIYNEHQPKIYECHYKLPDSTGLDAGSFARTPEMLREIL